MPNSCTTPPPSSNRTCRSPASGSHVKKHRKHPFDFLAMQLLPQRRQARRQPRLFRSGIDSIQAALLSSCKSTFPSRPLRSTVITRFFATMRRSDFRSRPAGGYGFPHAVGGSPTTRPGLPGPSTALSLRAVPSHPGGPGGCMRPLLHRRQQASSSLEDWPPPLCVTRPMRVRLRYGSQVRLPRLRRLDCSSTALGWLRVERAIHTVNSFQFTRSARFAWHTRGHRGCPKGVRPEVLGMHSLGHPWCFGCSMCGVLLDCAE